ncbi:MAG: efflux RND transporter permease subunit [Armatimonadetes bacterium]|nr:efflux RND transporter permease subunit [Armatimonadota bacterium]MDE2206546.1 efflux RND transporter permease subunit [Armatimonadota bacterium]
MSRAPNPRRGTGGLSRIPQWSIEHPYVVVPFYVAVIAVAILCVRSVIPRRFAPYVPSPELGVVTAMPGLSAKEMELQVSGPLEQQLIDVQNLHYVRSISENGISIVILEFNYGTDMSKAQASVQTLLNVAQANLPVTGANLKPSFIIPVDSLNLPVITFSLTGDASQGWTMAKLREFADNTVVRKLKALSDVFAVVTFGGYRRQIQVIVDRNKLAAYGLSILNVRDAIDTYNVSEPAGTITTSATESIIRVDSRARSAADVAAYPLTAHNGAIIRVGDVAHVVDSWWERKSAYNYLSHAPGTAGSVTPSIEVSVIQNPGASSYQVVPGVNRVIHQVEHLYPGTHFAAAYDNAHFVNILFNNVWEELGLAVLLTALVVVFFLGEWRGTLIALITLPTALAMAVLMLVPFHMTFNSGTLIGLLLSIGRLTDDTIIDIHSVERHLRMGKNARTATIDGIAEVRMAVIGSTVVLILALSPLLVCGGITQLMFVELVWPIIFGLLASMLVSFTLTALLCANWLRPESARDADRKHWLLRWLYLPLDPFQHMLDRLEKAYTRAIRSLLRNRFLNVAAIGVTVIIGLTVYHFIGSEMMPLADVGQASGVLEMKPGTSFEATENAVHQLEQIMLKYPELQRASIEIGTENMFESFSPYFTGYQMPQADGASMMLTFIDKDQRRRSIWQLMDGIRKQALATIPGIRRLQLKEMGADVMATSDAPVDLIISGPSLKELAVLGRQTRDIARHTPGLVQTATTWAMGVPDYVVHVDPARAQQVGLTPASIAEQTYYAMHGGVASQFFQLPNIRQDTIDIRYRGSQRLTPDQLGLMMLATPSGTTIPLKAVASVELQSAPTAIEHDGLQRVIGVTGYYRKGGPPSMDLAMSVMMKAMDTLNFPPGYNIAMRGDMTQMMESFRRLLYGLLFALVLMYLVLVAQFRGFLQPLQMLASLPLELSGVFFALWIAHQAFSTVSIMAIIVLSGMDMTAAILMIDLVSKYRDRGIPRDRAIEEACPQRLRPILMTALITIVVMAPVALAPRTGLDAYQPLGTTILGGLTVGTLLSLFEIPLMHTYVDDLVKWIQKVFLKRDWTWPVIDESAEERESG